MIGGFVFQLTALHFGELGLVQAILAAELLFVFGYLAVAGSRRPKLRDWLAVATLSRSGLLDDDNPDPPHPAPRALTSAAPPPRGLPVTVGRP